MLGDPSLKKYAGKSPELYYKKALAALAGTDHSFCVKFSKSIRICNNTIRVVGLSAFLCNRCGYLSVPLWKFGLDESAALRAQEIYWRTVRNIGG
jgi:hypothetical protein